MSVEKLKSMWLAELCFLRAGALAKHMVETTPTFDDLLYGPMVAGIVVTYTQPFKQNPTKGVLRLVGFDTFSDYKLQTTHEEVVRVRDKIYAHLDAEDVIKKMASSCGTKNLEMTLKFVTHTEYVIHTRVPDVTPDTVPDIMELCDFQAKKVKKEIEAALAPLTEGKRYEGERLYIIGEDFP